MPTFLPEFLAQGAVPSDLRALILAVADACRDIGQAVNTSAIAGVQGALAQENVQGEVQKQLDVIANDLMLEPKRWGDRVAALVSEEMEEIYPLGPGKFILVFDPIDGSSNVDVNGVVGTIFSVLDAPDGPVEVADVLQNGRRQIAAGYAIYGPQTTLVLTTGDGVSAFSLDQSGAWQLTEATMKIPAATREFAINMSNYRHWPKPMLKYIDECLAGVTGPRGADFNMRWLASMVGDVHRILTRGGIFMYPVDTRKNIGKLRLMYEANPIAFLVEQAGGAAIDEHGAILDIAPKALHQRTGVILGSREEVERVASYYAE